MTAHLAVVYFYADIMFGIGGVSDVEVFVRQTPLFTVRRQKFTTTGGHVDIVPMLQLRICLMD